MSANCSVSLRGKVGKIVAIFSIILVSFYTSMMAGLYELGLSNAAHGLVWHEAVKFNAAYGENKNTPLPKSNSMQGFIGEENIPDHILEKFSNIKWQKDEIWDAQFMHHRLKTEGKEYHHHIVSTALPNTDKKFYLYLGISIEDKIVSKVWRKFKVLAIIGGLFVIFMLFIFNKIIQRSLDPIGSLSKWIGKLEDSRVPKDLPSDIKDDEIGQMAKCLYEALTRIHQHNEREREFLRNASHELRTPIAIIRNAMDVIEYKQTKGNSDIAALLQRIRRAGDTMKSVTEAILWLVIDGYTAPTKSETKLKPMLKEVVQKNASLLNGKSVKIRFSVDKLDTITAESTLIHIAIDNIIRNAFQHCSDGAITIEGVTSNKIKVTNSHSSYCKPSPEIGSIDIAVETGGFGLGLALVKKIAGRQGWIFNFDINQEQAVATLEIPEKLTKKAAEEENLDDISKNADAIFPI